MVTKRPNYLIKINGKSIKEVNMELLRLMEEVTTLSF